MSIDVFGRKLGRSESSRGPPGIGYKLTPDGDYDVEKRRIINLAEPKELQDAITLQYLKTECNRIFEFCEKLRKDFEDLKTKLLSPSEGDIESVFHKTANLKDK